MDAKAKSDEGNFRVRVNGGEFTVPSENPTALEILELAKERGLMARDPKGYYLYGETGKHSVEDRINVRKEKVFCTIPNKATPVA